jgi:hypothetical protein
MSVALRRLLEASAARYTDVVVLPTPPLSAAVTMIMTVTVFGPGHDSVTERVPRPE